MVALCVPNFVFASAGQLSVDYKLRTWLGIASRCVRWQAQQTPVVDESTHRKDQDTELQPGRLLSDCLKAR